MRDSGNGRVGRGKEPAARARVLPCTITEYSLMAASRVPLPLSSYQGGLRKSSIFGWRFLAWLDCDGSEEGSFCAA